MRSRHMALAGAVAATLGLSGVGLAQSVSPGSNAPNLDATGRPVTEAPARAGAQAVNPSPMTPGSRANEAPGMGAGTAGQQAQSRENPTPMAPGTRAGEAPGMGGAASQRGPAQAQGTGAPDTQVSPGTAPATAPPGQASGPLPGSTQPPGATQSADPGAARPGTTAQRPMPNGTATTAPRGDAATTPRGDAATTPRGDAATTPRGDAATTPRGDAATGALTPAAPAESGGARTTPRAGAPLEGANSFTEGQARSRISDAGFGDVQDLRLDDRGVWRGRGMRNGQQVGVAMDYQGNVVADR
ncbi:hypothetical protein [Falsiroseomonas sp. E2-1-a20]|uniref:hypothetical protein n=1 Tax=Falsiroseomonas sp. E2-1-a20 TaxID=3239300 RepID=UPI003F378ADC